MLTMIGVNEEAALGDDVPFRLSGMSSCRLMVEDEFTAESRTSAIWLPLTEVVPGAGAVITVTSIVRSPLGEKKVMISAEGIVAPHS